MAAESTARFPEKTKGGPRRERLARRRKALGLTQEALAARLEVERTTVVRWERGETQPLPWQRPRLARVLGVSADQLTALLADGERPAGDDPDDERRPRAAGAGVGPAGVPRQLPAAVADFTGRASELATLDDILNAAAHAPGTVVISAISGPAGVGKTALALHWAHQVAGRFPDGQLHVNLRGSDPATAPVTAAEAIRWFLDVLGVPPDRRPLAPDARAALYRSLLAGKRMLILLDNAREEQQVRPLLPASPGSLVIVTSRNSLTGLAATGGARLLSLDVLPRRDAVALLSARIGPDRAAAEPSAIAEIAALCGCLPLALGAAAARAAVRPEMPLSALAAELRESGGLVGPDAGTVTVRLARARN